jgi:hypothetical protein
VGEEFDPLTAPLEDVLGRVEAEVAIAPDVPEPTAVEPTAVEPVAVQPAAPPTPRADESSAVVETPGPTEESEVSEVTDLDVMLSMLAAEHRAMDRTSIWNERMGDRSTRLAVMVGGTALVALAFFVALTVLGAIF